LDPQHGQPNPSLSWTHRNFYNVYVHQCNRPEALRRIHIPLQVIYYTTTSLLLLWHGLSIG